MKTDIIAKVKDAVSKTTKKVVKISGEAIDYTKLKLKVAEIDSKLDEKYAAIGLAVYEENDEADIETICEEISALKQERNALKLKIDEYRSQKTCPACSAATDKENTYCPVCGIKF